MESSISIYKNNQFENIIKMKFQNFFHTYPRNGREKYFTYPQNLSTFQKMMETKIDISQ